MTLVRWVWHLILLCFICICNVSQAQVVREYCVIGAGPSGLQMGYFLKMAHRDFIIFEKSSKVGNFFETYPRHRILISINKRFTGKTNHEFNLRHDWNSLISNDKSLLFTKYSSELFPHADDYIQYLDDYRTKLGLNVQFNTTISNINKLSMNDKGSNASIFTMKDQKENVYNCKHLIIATGLQNPVKPAFNGSDYVEGYETVPIDPKGFEGQTVLILGRGNSAFEVAQGIYGATNHIHMIARSRVRLSWSTHYVGDLRAVNNALLDTYQLKSLDAVLEASISEIEIKKRAGRLYLHSMGDEYEFDNFAMREPYDRVIRCLGFQFDSSLFHKDLGYQGVNQKRLSKFPNISYNYESQDIPGLFFAGTNTHIVDFRKSAGGFIHGYRYTARALHRHLEWRNHQQPWPSTTLPSTKLLNTILLRINEASGNYQMFSILADVFIIRDGGKQFVHLEEYPLQTIHKLKQISGHEPGPLIIWVYEYGTNFSGPGKDVFRSDRAVGDPIYAYQSNFLHPVLYYYRYPPTDAQMASKSHHKVLPRPDKILHIVEDFLTLWDAPISHILPLRRFIESCVGFDLRHFFAETCFEYALTHASLPLSCEQHMQEFLHPTRSH